MYESTCTSKHHIQTPYKFAEYYYPPAGDPNISNKMNSLIFKAVQDFIAQSGRFAMEWQTQLNSYWHKSILSLSLSDWCFVIAIFMLVNINIPVVEKSI